LTPKIRTELQIKGSAEAHLSWLWAAGIS